MKKLIQELTEMTKQPTINDLLSPEEQQKVEQILKQGGSLENTQQVVEQRLREMGVNVPLNVGVFLKWAHSLDRQYNPGKFKGPPLKDVEAAWDSYGKARAKGWRG